MIAAMIRPSALNAMLIDAPFMYCGPSAEGNLEMSDKKKESACRFQKKKEQLGAMYRKAEVKERHCPIVLIKPKPVAR